MGVYIDMEMPPDGRYTVCITHDSNGGIHWVFQNQDTLEFLKHGAVTEVPEPHGRLYDLYDIFDDMQHSRGIDINCSSPGMTADLFQGYAPVIPASKED